MKLEHAQIIAAEIVNYMRPWCTRVEVAGSIRRERPDVKDIEICAVPFWGVQSKSGSLFGETEPLNTLHQAMTNMPSDVIKIEWIKPGTSVIEKWAIKPEGKYWRGLVAGAEGQGPAMPIKLDLFLAAPENWGVIYTIRTGSDDFSRALVTHARDKTPYCVEGGYLVERSEHPGKRVNCLEEADLFSMIDLEWIEPRERVNDNSLRRVVH